MKLKLPADARAAIAKHAEDTFPEECCGAMLGHLGEDGGDNRAIVEIMRIENTKGENRERRFLIDPMEVMRAEKMAKQKGLDVVGIYHSHPDHPSRPSDFDRDHAMPFWSYVIVSCMQGVSKTIQSWQLREDRSQFDEEALSE